MDKKQKTTLAFSTLAIVSSILIFILSLVGCTGRKNPAQTTITSSNSSAEPPESTNSNATVPSYPTSSEAVKSPTVSKIPTVAGTPSKTTPKPPAKTPGTTSQTVSVQNTPQKPAVASNPASHAEEKPAEQAPAISEELFVREFSATMRQYKNEVQIELNQYKSMVAPINQQIDTLDVNYLVQQRQLREQYANMGLLNSGQYQSALSGLTASYNRQKRDLQAQAAPFNDRINHLQQELDDPDLNEILARIAIKHDLTVSQVIDAFEKYMLDE